MTALELEDVSNKPPTHPILINIIAVYLSPSTACIVNAAAIGSGSSNSSSTSNTLSIYRALLTFARKSLVRSSLRLFLYEPPPPLSPSPLLQICHPLNNALSRETASHSCLPACLSVCGSVCPWVCLSPFLRLFCRMSAEKKKMKKRQGGGRKRKKEIAGKKESKACEPYSSSLSSLSLSLLFRDFSWEAQLVYYGTENTTHKRVHSRGTAR